MSVTNNSGPKEATRFPEVKITPAVREEILERHEEGESDREIAEALSLSPRSVRRVIRGASEDADPVAALERQVNLLERQIYAEALQSDPEIREQVIAKRVGPRERPLDEKTLGRARDFFTGQGITIVPASEVTGLRVQVARLQRENDALRTEKVDLERRTAIAEAGAAPGILQKLGVASEAQQALAPYRGALVAHFAGAVQMAQQEGATQPSATQPSAAALPAA